MNQSEQHGFRGTAVVEETSEQIGAAVPPVVSGNQPYVPAKNKMKSSLKENGRLLFVGAGMVLVLLLFTFSGLSKKAVPARNSNSANRNQPQTESQSTASASASLTPI